MSIQEDLVLIVASRAGFREREVQEVIRSLGRNHALLRLDKGLLEGSDFEPRFPSLGPEEQEAPEQHEGLYQAEAARLLNALRPGILVAIGLEAGAWCASRTELPFVTLVAPQDISFARTRVKHTERFERVKERTTAFICSDILVQNSLVDKGSRKPHLLWRPFASQTSAEVPRRPEQEQPKQIVFFAKSRQRFVALGTAERREIRRALREQDSPEPEVFSYYRASKKPTSAPKGDSAPFPELTSEELLVRGFGGSLCVFLGDSDDHAAAARRSVQEGASLLFEDSIHNRLIAREIPNAAIVPRWRIVKDLPRLIRDCSERHIRHSESRPNAEMSKMLDIEHLAALPWFYEEMAHPPTGDAMAVVLGSVGGFPIRRNRARAVRLQSILEALLSSYSPILLQASENFIQRRGLLLKELHAQRKLRFGYFESSTTPVQLDFQEAFFSILRQLQEWNVPSGWFMRDAHYLFSDFGFEEEHRQKLLVAARGETKHVAAYSDKIYAPSRELLQRFVQHSLFDGGVVDRFIPLSPGTEVSSERSGPLVITSKKEPITLVYCGGASSGVYRMPIYHKAVRRFLRSRRLRFVFISREDEIDTIKSHYSKSQQKRIEFLSMSLDEYQPTTPLTFGVTFFEHPYGKATVPLKFYSYLSMNFPILAYDDCSYSKLVEDRNLGLTCRPDFRSMRLLLKRLEKTKTLEFDLSGFVAENTWQKRTETIAASLEEVAATRGDSERQEP